MTKENNAAVLILLTDANFKNLIDDGIPLHNFEFRKKIALLLTKDFLQKFSKFSRKSELCKKMQPRGNSIELSTILNYGLTKVKKAALQMFELVLNMPL